MRLVVLLAAVLLHSAAFGQMQPAARPKAVPAKSVKPAAPPAAPAAARPAGREVFAVTVAGSIINADGLPLPGATVWNPSTREILAVTNAQGEFVLTLPTNAAVTLTCGYAGLADQQISLPRPHRRNDLVISLEPGATPTAR